MIGPGNWQEKEFKRGTVLYLQYGVVMYYDTYQCYANKCYCIWYVLRSIFLLSSFVETRLLRTHWPWQNVQLQY